MPILNATAGAAGSCSWCDDLRATPKLPGAFCWTRMQAEAGQPLETIVRRKELERAVGGGVFYWGVGNPLGAGITELLRRTSTPEVMFSVMRSKPKPVDTAPSSVLLWTGYLDATRAINPLPAHALVLSRGDTLTGVAKRCYALVCHSDTPLSLASLACFDLTHFRNITGKRGKIGFSQVTTNIEHLPPRQAGLKYDVNLRASLIAPYFVRLVGAKRISLEDRHRIAAVVEANPSPDFWRDFVQSLREHPPYAFDCGEASLDLRL